MRGERGGAPSDETYQQRMAHAWQRLGARVLLVLSGNDYTAKEFVGAQTVNRHEEVPFVNLAQSARRAVGPGLPDFKGLFRSSNLRNPKKCG